MTVLDENSQTIIQIKDLRTINQEYSDQDFYFVVSSQDLIDTIPADKIKPWIEHDPDCIFVDITLLPEEFSDFLATLKKTEGFRKIGKEEFEVYENNGFSDHGYTYIFIDDLHQNEPDKARISIKGFTWLGYNVWKKYSNLQYELEDQKHAKDMRELKIESIAPKTP